VLITKFNRLIRNRVIWAFFAALISVAFVFTFSKGGGCEKPGASRQGSVGVLYGKDVTGTELTFAKRGELGMRRNAALPPEADEELRERAWARLAALHTAARLGLGATDAEIAETIRSDRNFWEAGAFSQPRYRSLVQQHAAVPIGTFESFVRDQITLEKLKRLASELTWTPPSEVSEKLVAFSDLREVQYDNRSFNENGFACPHCGGRRASRGGAAPP